MLQRKRVVQEDICSLTVTPTGSCSSGSFWGSVHRGCVCHFSFLLKSRRVRVGICTNSLACMPKLITDGYSAEVLGGALALINTVFTKCIGVAELRHGE